MMYLEIYITKKDKNYKEVEKMLKKLEKLEIPVKILDEKLLSSPEIIGSPCPLEIVVREDIGMLEESEGIELTEKRREEVVKHMMNNYSWQDYNEEILDRMTKAPEGALKK